MKRLAWVTGTSRVDGNGYLENKFLSLCATRKKKVEIIYPGKMIFEAPGIPLDKNNVLNAPDDHLKPKMQWVFERIIDKLPEYLKKNDVVIIKTHRLFKWDNSYRLAHAPEYVMQLKPDVMVTFVDGITPILNRLKKSNQFQFQDYTKEDVCDWQHLEIKLTKEWAEMIGRPFFVIPSAESPELLYHLIFDPDVEPVYVAVDITHSSPDLKKRVDSFVQRTRKYFPFLISPYTVPLDYEDDNKGERSHIVNMCLDEFVGQSKIVIGYYPVVMPSHGKPHELGKAYILTKDVWVVYLPKKAGPFEEHFKTRPIFRSEKDFFEFLAERQNKK